MHLLCVHGACDTEGVGCQGAGGHRRGQGDGQGDGQHADAEGGGGASAGEGAAGVAGTDKGVRVTTNSRLGEPLNPPAHPPRELKSRALNRMMYGQSQLPRRGNAPPSPAVTGSGDSADAAAASGARRVSAALYRDANVISEKDFMLVAIKAPSDSLGVSTVQRQRQQRGAAQRYVRTVRSPNVLRNVSFILRNVSFILRNVSFHTKPRMPLQHSVCPPRPSSLRAVPQACPPPKGGPPAAGAAVRYAVLCDVYGVGRPPPPSQEQPVFSGIQGSTKTFRELAKKTSHRTSR
jgi:hypothetical protein